ncbi:MAG: response regulator [candidate division KSB1 bacterium]|nr:response regulator [candidate division KSB1 bacterium]
MTKDSKKILWVDDEIDLLRPHVMFLQSKGYDMTTFSNAEDAIDRIKNTSFDLVLLDEMLNGMDGLTALGEIKSIDPSLPVIMVTKNEEETLMEEAIGQKIDDYLTKPVNPSQILLVCKKILDRQKIAGQRISRDYSQEFQQISAQLQSSMDWQDWIDVHIKLCTWDIELDGHPDLGLKQTLYDQKREANAEFGRFVENNYYDWIHNESSPPMSVDVIRNYVLPQVSAGKNTVFMVIDAMRLDQWMTLESLLHPYFRINRDFYYSILPTATPYSRNAIFSGLFPGEMHKELGELWKNAEDKDDVSLNRHELELLQAQLQRLDISLKPDPKYAKILDVQGALTLSRKIHDYGSIPLSAIVLNFVDILAHSRSSSSIIREMIPNESAFRSTTYSWFEHSHIFKAMRTLADMGVTVVITSDHGSIRGKRGARVIGDRRTSTSLRYKYGENLKADDKHAMFIKDPRDYKLPARGVTTNYIIAKEDYYFVYPTNYHHYLNYYADSFQHGGISLEEVVLPVITLEPK